MLVNLSAKTIAFLREAVASWAEVKRCLRLLRSIRGSGAARVTTSDTEIVIDVSGPGLGDGDIFDDPPRRFLITSSELIRPNCWRYKGKECRMKRPPLNSDTYANGVTNVYEVIPDAEEVTLYNLAELNNDNTRIAEVIEITGPLIGVLVCRGVVMARRERYGAYVDDESTEHPAGDCFTFYKENPAWIDCEGGGGAGLMGGGDDGGY